MPQGDDIIPPLIRVRQRFSAEKIDDVQREVRSQLDATGVSIRPGSKIAITAGSRGITNIVVILREVVAWVKARGASPFIVPAMGSHGGATAEGQQRLLESYGIAEDNIGAPIRSTMEVVELPPSDLGIPVFFDKHAYDADGTIVVNRVKPHTSFHGRHESGLLKMCAIGLGKQAQAAALHGLGVRGLRDIMPQVARHVLQHANIVLGLAIVENAFEDTHLIQGMPASDFCDQEPALLVRARALLPRLPVIDLDILIVDEMGKNISGLGMDTNVIGRLKIPGEAEPETPRIRMIIVRDLTDESQGNAIGVGLADIITRRLFDKIDFHATYQNAYTSTFLERAKVPVIADTDAEALRFALRASGVTDIQQARIIRIRNTLHLDELQVSCAVLDELAADRQGIEVMGDCGPLLDGNNLLNPFSAT